MAAVIAWLVVAIVMVAREHRRINADRDLRADVIDVRRMRAGYRAAPPPAAPEPVAIGPAPERIPRHSATRVVTAEWVQVTREIGDMPWLAGLVSDAT